MTGLWWFQKWLASLKVSKEATQNSLAFFAYGTIIIYLNITVKYTGLRYNVLYKAHKM